jgi:hypothetical protein
MVPSRITTSTMHLKVLGNATASPCSFPIVADIEGYNNTQTDFTLTILPALTFPEQWHNQMQSVADFISPVNSIWTFITAIGAVMVPLFSARIQRSKIRIKRIIKKMDSYSSDPQ